MSELCLSVYPKSLTSDPWLTAREAMALRKMLGVNVTVQVTPSFSVTADEYITEDWLARSILNGRQGGSSD